MIVHENKICAYLIGKKYQKVKTKKYKCKILGLIKMELLESVCNKIVTYDEEV
jgi:hypothetical protein